MKSKPNFNFLFSIGILILIVLSLQSYSKEVIESPISTHLKKMNLIEGGTITIGSTAFQNITPKDKTLFFTNIPRRQKVASFYISATEVTNAEWRVFYEDKIKELGAEEALELYYPDTLVWLSDFEDEQTIAEPMTYNYFQNSAFKDYPVLGISWVQVQVFCKWKTQKLKLSAKKIGKEIDLTFRLPTEAEWEYAAKSPQEVTNQEIITRINLYPWDGYEFKKNGKYLANNGAIWDNNGIGIKYYPDDGCQFTCNVGAYLPNGWGLYDMAGNVAEWVLDTAAIYRKNNRKFKLHKVSDAEVLIQTVKNKIANSDKKIKNIHQKEYERLIHDKDILSRGDMRTIKGGSWDDGLAYLQIGSREGMDKDRQSSRVGFRIAASSHDGKYSKYFPKKSWKPNKK